MDRAYEGDETREKAKESGLIPVVPQKKNRKNPWDYDKEIYPSTLINIYFQDRHKMI
jgi:hypothetical protein